MVVLVFEECCCALQQMFFFLRPDQTTHRDEVKVVSPLSSIPHISACNRTLVANIHLWHLKDSYGNKAFICYFGSMGFIFMDVIVICTYKFEFLSQALHDKKQRKELPCDIYSMWKADKAIKKKLFRFSPRQNYSRYSGVIFELQGNPSLNICPRFENGINYSNQTCSSK